MFADSFDRNSAGRSMTGALGASTPPQLCCNDLHGNSRSGMACLAPRSDGERELCELSWSAAQELSELLLRIESELAN